MTSCKYDFRKSSNRYVGIGKCSDCWNCAYNEKSQYKTCEVTLTIHDSSRIRCCPFYIFKDKEYKR